AETLEVPMRGARRLAAAAGPMRAVDQDARQMRDRAWRRGSGDPPQQVPFGFGCGIPECRGDRVAARDSSTHEIWFLREQERVPAWLEIRISARAVGKTLVMVDIREDGGGRGAELER